jgi:hypothetical protein
MARGRSGRRQDGDAQINLWTATSGWLSLSSTSRRLTVRCPAGVVKAGDRTLGVVRLAITEKGRTMIVR